MQNKNDRHLNERLASSGLRFTPQRRCVYDVLTHKRDHPTADEVFMCGTAVEVQIGVSPALETRQAEKNWSPPSATTRSPSSSATAIARPFAGTPEIFCTAAGSCGFFIGLGCWQFSGGVGVVGGFWGAIGQDVSSGVLQLLFARPIRRSEYVLSRRTDRA